MWYKLATYYKSNRSLDIFLVPALFLTLLVGWLVSKQLYYNNVKMLFYLLTPVMFIGIIPKMLTVDFSWNSWELISTYQESKVKIFCYKYIIGLVVCLTPLLLGVLAGGITSYGEYDILMLFLTSLILSMALGNLALLMAVLAKRYEVGLITGLILLVLSSRFHIPTWFQWGGYLLIAVGSLVLALRIFTHTGGDWK